MNKTAESVWSPLEELSNRIENLEEGTTEYDETVSEIENVLSDWDHAAGRSIDSIKASIVVR